VRSGAVFRRTETDRHVAIPITRVSRGYKPRLRAELSGIERRLESCCLRPIMINSVLEELRVRRLADILDRTVMSA